MRLHGGDARRGCGQEMGTPWRRSTASESSLDMMPIMSSRSCTLPKSNYTFRESLPLAHTVVALRSGRTCVESDLSASTLRPTLSSVESSSH